MTWLFEKIFPYFIWRKPSASKVLYITFDDGPIPQVTPWVLEQLEKYGAVATFFCVGENITKFPQIFQEILNRGHAVGNHTYNHLNGWETRSVKYLQNVQEFEDLHRTQLFRPPYGRIKKRQYRPLLSTHKIIMWSVLTKDYSTKISPEQCLQRSLQNSKPGDIIVFHDSLKAEANLRYTLPRFLANFKERGFTFEKLD